MGENKSGVLSKIILWITFLTMGSAAVAMFFMLGK
jgi:hypothetical protein